MRSCTWRAQSTSRGEEDEEEACVRVEEVKVEVEEEEEGQEENEEEEEKVQEEQEEKHEEEQQEKELKDELVPFKKSEEVSTLRKTVSSLQSHLVDGTPIFIKRRALVRALRSDNCFHYDNWQKTVSPFAGGGARSDPTQPG
nr:FK506-binding nuclear protein-like [Penaeus vannamei]